MRHASALKARRQNELRRVHNYQVRNAVRTLTKKVFKAIEEKKTDLAVTLFKEAQSAWKRASHRHIFHKKAADRHVSRMASRLSGLLKAKA